VQEGCGGGETEKRSNAKDADNADKRINADNEENRQESYGRGGEEGGKGRDEMSERIVNGIPPQHCCGYLARTRFQNVCPASPQTPIDILLHVS